jgi:hypothetical protein
LSVPASAQQNNTDATISLPPGFRIDEIKPVPAPAQPPPPLGVLSNFTGVFEGRLELDFPSQ